MMRSVLVVLLLSSSTGALADEDPHAADDADVGDMPAGAGDPVGDPPPPPTIVEEPAVADPLDAEEVDEGVNAPAPGARAPLPPPERSRPSRVRGPSALEVLGLSGAAGAAAGLTGAAGALAIGGATLATVLAVEQGAVTPEARSFVLLALVGGAVATPFAAAFAASLSTLFVTNPTARPEEYAELTQTCLSCAAAAACAGLCVAGAFVGGPSMVLSPSCAAPMTGRGPLPETENPAAFAAGVGAGLGAVVGAGVVFLSLRSLDVQESVTFGGALVGGAAGGAAVGGLVVGTGAVLVERWRYVTFE